MSICKYMSKIVYDPAGDYNIPSLDEIEYIITSIEKIQQHVKKQENIDLMKSNFSTYEEKMHDCFNDFSDKYYSIFYKLIRNEDINPVFDMLEKLMEINKGNLTVEKAEQQIGVAIANKYMK